MLYFAKHNYYFFFIMPTVYFYLKFKRTYFILFSKGNSRLWIKKYFCSLICQVNPDRGYY